MIYTCGTCQEGLEAEDFFRDKKAKHGRKLHMCKACYAERFRNKKKKGAVLDVPPNSLLNLWIMGQKLTGHL